MHISLDSHALSGLTLDSHTNTVRNFSRLPTHQDGVENRDKVYLYASLLANELQLENNL